MFKRTMAKIFAFALVAGAWAAAALLALVTFAGVPLAAYTVWSTWQTYAAAHDMAGDPGVVVKARHVRPRGRADFSHCRGEFRPNRESRTVVVSIEGECKAQTQGRLIRFTPWEKPETVVTNGSSQWMVWAFISILPILWTLALVRIAVRRVKRRGSPHV